ncbi:hypothetical protein [Kaistella jeonii]|uniref:LysM domain-containing protein n=1 Tax=Kaistella jeonii TaxID=266749 RepID=A0A0C1EYX8_9FLAO|nr:hypothetical protein [Kaistella jeonii]KIA86037.1 hypothetical protein OA86_14095 [Kaistella jeonii]SFC36181.1 hypothetical protein SAMN05421876_1167 [Kaistella jeonii]VEI97312.1 Uncharacterised protein [Kaistella jeonii]
MKKDDLGFIKLKIEGVFNLQQVASEYNLTSLELVTFHNRFCSIAELLPISLPKHVEYVYLPAQNFQVREVRLLKSTTLNLPKNVTVKKYGVLIKYLPKELQIHYQVNVKHNSEFVEITKEKTYVNDQEIDQTVEQLFEKAEQALYPMQISTDQSGRLDHILNSKTIADNWKKDCEPKLREYYQSDTADKIFQKLDVAFSDLDTKLELLNRNIFFKLFFLNVYQNYSNVLKEDFKSIYFANLKEDITFKTKYNLEKEYTTGDKIALNITGYEEENIFNKDREKGKLDLVYKFHKETHEIFSIIGFISAFEKNVEYKIIFQLYELEYS